MGIRPRVRLGQTFALAMDGVGMNDLPVADTVLFAPAVSWKPSQAIGVKKVLGEEEDQTTNHLLTISCAAERHRSSHSGRLRSPVSERRRSSRFGGARSSVSGRIRSSFGGRFRSSVS
jgi:hypothetical protein